MTLPEIAAQAQRLQVAFVEASMDKDRAAADAQAAAAEADAAADDAAARARDAAAHRAALGRFAAQTYTSSVGGLPLVQALTANPNDPFAAIDTHVAINQANTVLARQVEASAGVLAAAEVAATRAAMLAEVAQEARAAAEAALSATQRDAQVLSTYVAAADTDGLTEALRDAQQEARNVIGRRAWKRYRREVAAADVPTPDRVQTTSPATLPAPLEPAVTARGAFIPGTSDAETDQRTLPVLPQQAVTAVQAALAALGTPFAPGRRGPEAFGCSPFVAAAYAEAGIDVPATLEGQANQIPTLAAGVPPRAGDIVHLGSPDAPTEVSHTGIYLFSGTMIAADAATGAVNVVPAAPKQIIAVQRPAVPRRAAARALTRNTTGRGLKVALRAAPTLAARDSIECGASVAYLTNHDGMIFPLPAGTYRLTATFGQEGASWATTHTGQDFAAPIGTPVFATKDGIVTTSHPAWAGNLVTVNHGEGLTTRYAHLDSITVRDGAVVTAGQQIGTVGNEGNSRGPHLHFEVLHHGQSRDPMPYLIGTVTARGWGGHANGLIPAHELCSLKSAPGHRLRCDAARALDALSAAHQDTFGEPLCLTDSYRSYAAQVDLFALKPDLAAIPGTSNHGWGLAIDACGGIESFTHPRHRWMVDQAPRYGWNHPRWAASGGSRPEPWHWEFGVPQQG